MNFNVAELQQHEAAWLAYGKRRASRLRWKKATNAEFAATLDVAALIKKIEAHDKHVWIARVWFRVFTSIERQREMLVYCLGRDVFSALITSPVPSTLVAQRVNLEKLAAVTTRTSRFSWFKKPLNAFMGWVKEKMGSAVVVSDRQPGAEPIVQDNHPEVVLPVVLDSQAAVEAFYEKMNQALSELALLYRQCSRKLHEYKTSGERLANFEVCFKPYKIKLRELQLYYHPDKVTHDKAVAAGLTDETFVTEAGNAFTQIQFKYKDLEAKRIAIRDSDNRIVELDRKIIEAKEENARAKEACAREIERTAELQAKAQAEAEAYKARAEERHREAAEREKARENNARESREYRDAYNGGLEQLAELKAKLAAVETVILARTSHLRPAPNNIAHAPESVVTSPENATPSTNPSAFFAGLSSAPVQQSCATDKLDDVPVFRQA